MRALGFAIVASVSAFAGVAAAAEDEVVAIRAGRLIDVVRERVLEDQVIVVEDARIREVGPAQRAEIPAGAKVIDLGGHTVMPGFVDTHTHLVSDPTVSYYDSYNVRWCARTSNTAPI
jgi:imidazolonepropionase-like amidohydrolase